MAKMKGFKISLDYFLPIDQSDFGKQSAAFALADAIQKGNIPDDFFKSAIAIGVTVKQGSSDIDIAPPKDDAKDINPADVPLTTDPLPEGATVLEASEALDGSMFQTIRLVDGTETYRRISHEQNAAENPDIEPAATKMEGKKVTERGGKPVAE